MNSINVRFYLNNLRGCNVVIVDGRRVSVGMVPVAAVYIPLLVKNDLDI
jgi:hypothetical protein